MYHLPYFFPCNNPTMKEVYQIWNKSPSNGFRCLFDEFEMTWKFFYLNVFFCIFMMTEIFENTFNLIGFMTCVNFMTCDNEEWRSPFLLLAPTTGGASVDNSEELLSIWYFKFQNLFYYKFINIINLSRFCYIICVRLSFIDIMFRVFKYFRLFGAYLVP